MMVHINQAGNNVFAVMLQRKVIYFATLLEIVACSLQRYNNS